MFERMDEGELRCSAVSLEDGADEARMHGERVGLHDCGMSFPSRWQFSPGTTLAMTLEISGRRDRVEAVVIECEEKGARMWEVTVLFLSGGGLLAGIGRRAEEVEEEISPRGSVNRGGGGVQNF